MEFLCIFISFIAIVDAISLTNENSSKPSDDFTTTDEICRICTRELQDECEKQNEGIQKNGTTKSNKNAGCKDMWEKSIYDKKPMHERCFKGGDEFECNQNNSPTRLSILPPKNSFCYFNITVNHHRGNHQQFEDRLYVAKNTSGEICSEKNRWSIQHSCLFGEAYEKKFFEECLKLYSDSLIYELTPKYGRVT